jgi:hypothetical protein
MHSKTLVPLFTATVRYGHFFFTYRCSFWVYNAWVRVWLGPLVWDGERPLTGWRRRKGCGSLSRLGEKGTCTTRRSSGRSHPVPACLRLVWATAPHLLHLWVIFFFSHEYSHLHSFSTSPIHISDLIMKRGDGSYLPRNKLVTIFLWRIHLQDSLVSFNIYGAHVVSLLLL